jgi:hypothetical protein
MINYENVVQYYHNIMLSINQWHNIITLVCKPILQAKWSNKQKTKVLCIKVHFVHFYPSIIFKNQMCPNTE